MKMRERLKKYLFPGVIILGVAFFAFSGRDYATGAEYTYPEEPQIVAATFYSTWCASCKILEPRLSDVIPDFADKPVKFVEFDFTFGQRKEIQDQAAREGLGQIYPQFEGATGFTLLVDKETGEIIDTLTINHSKQAMRTAIAQALAVASRAQTTE